MLLGVPLVENPLCCQGWTCQVWQASKHAQNGQKSELRHGVSDWAEILLDDSYVRVGVKDNHTKFEQKNNVRPRTAVASGGPTPPPL